MISPNSLNEALNLLASKSNRWVPFAGGTDLMVVYDAGKMAPTKFLDLHKLSELATIQMQGDDLIIGAMATYQQIKSHPIILKNFPNLAAAARQTGSIAIQNRGTIGGNIANASPAADTPPALISYHAEIEVVGKNGSRLIPYEQFHQGYKKIALLDRELICAVRLPLKTAHSQHYFRKVGTRNAQAISKIVMAAAANMNGKKVENLRIAFGSVGPTVVHCRSIEKLIQGNAITPELIENAKGLLRKEISPIDDIRSTSDYRQTVAENLLSQFLSSLF
jgi:CO/xanthine dehydrogenase FAD-binding subunit